jgi:hypothetical protein
MAPPRDDEDKPLQLAVAVLEEMGRNERHFNSLQSEYRKLASAWLLAALGAIGYVLLSSEAPETKTTLLFLTAIGSLIGIFVLWLLDVPVYHRLLKSVFSEAKRIEERYPELPQAHSSMRTNMGEGLVTRIISAFYFAIGCAAPGCVLAVNWSMFAAPQIVVLAGLPLAFGVTLYSHGKRGRGPGTDA